jgi:hypothetical protein
MNWSDIKLRDLEKVFDDIFNPELLYGKEAELYDEALTQSNHYGISWKQEMKDKDIYLDFIIDYLEKEEMKPEDFNSN